MSLGEGRLAFTQILRARHCWRMRAFCRRWRSALWTMVVGVLRRCTVSGCEAVWC